MPLLDRQVSAGVLHGPAYHICNVPYTIGKSVKACCMAWPITSIMGPYTIGKSVKACYMTWPITSVMCQYTIGKSVKACCMANPITSVICPYLIGKSVQACCMACSTPSSVLSTSRPRNTNSAKNKHSYVKKLMGMDHQNKKSFIIHVREKCFEHKIKIISCQ